MAIYNRSIERYRLLPLLLAFSFLVTACGQTAQPTATITSAPTSAQPTATMTPPPTPAQPTATMTPSPITAQPTATMTIPPTAAPTSTPVIESGLDMELPEGDSNRGLSRALQFGCVACHVHGRDELSFGAAAGLPSILERGELRIADPAYEGSASTNREYIIESVLFPEVYTIPGEWGEAMPTDYGDRMTEQDLADIIAWLSTFE